MMKKTALTIIVLAVVGAMLIGCSAGPAESANVAEEETTNEQASQAEESETSGEIEQTGAGKKIGISHFWLGNDWNKYLEAAERAYLEARGYEVIVTNGQTNNDQQKKDVENLIASDIDGLIIAGGEADVFYDLSLQAQEAGVPLVTVDMVLPGSIASVASDNYLGGTQLALFVIRQMRGTGKVVLLADPGWKSVSIRQVMIETILADYENIEVVGTFDVNGADPVNSGYSLTKSALKSNPDVDAIFCMWGIPCLGAAQAVEELGLNDQIILANADSDQAIIQTASLEGAPTWAILAQDSGVLGTKIAKIMDDVLVNGPESVPYMDWGPTYLISNIPVDEAFGEVGFLSLEDYWNIAYSDVDFPNE